MISSLISKFSLAGKRVVLLTGNGVSVHHWEGKTPLAPLWFSGDEVGIAHFGEYVANSPNDPTSILVDVVEEDFRLDAVPHVFGRDRRAVIQTKQNRLFRDSRYAQAMPQGREPDGRRDDRMLFTSIIRPELLDPWIAQLNRFKVPVVGIYSLPVVSSGMLKPLGLDDNNVLLVTIESRSGLRQSFFQDGQLKVSRLAPMQRMDVRRASGYILQEVERLRRYLNSLRLISRGMALDVYLVTHGAMLLDLERQAKDSVATRFHLLDTADVADALSVRETEHTPYMDTIFSTFLARSRIPNYYGTDEDVRYARHRRAGQAMTAAGVVALVGGIGWSGLNFAESLIQRQDIGTISKQANFYENRVRVGRERLPDLPAGGRQIERAVKAVDVIETYRENPTRVLGILGRSLDAFPEFEVEGIDWRVSSTSDGERRTAGNPRGFSEPIKSYFQIANLRGRIQTFAGDYRGAIDEVRRFAQSLEQIESVEAVNVLRLPLDLSSRQRLAGVATAAVEGAARFEVQVILRTHDD